MSTMDRRFGRSEPRKEGVPMTEVDDALLELDKQLKVLGDHPQYSLRSMVSAIARGSNMAQRDSDVPRVANIILTNWLEKVADRAEELDSFDVDQGDAEEGALKEMGVMRDTDLIEFVPIVTELRANRVRAKERGIQKVDEAARAKERERLFKAMQPAALDPIHRTWRRPPKDAA